jgi:hypothetical protein
MCNLSRLALFTHFILHTKLLLSGNLGFEFFYTSDTGSGTKGCLYGGSIGMKAFSQKGVQASWDAPRTKSGCLWTPKYGGKGKLFSMIP